MSLTFASPAPPVLQSDTFEILRQKINNMYSAFTASGIYYLSTPVIVAYATNAGNLAGGTGWPTEYVNLSFPGANWINATFAGTAPANNSSGSFNAISLAGVPSNASSVLLCGAHSDVQAGSGTAWAFVSSSPGGQQRPLMSGGQSGSGADSGGISQSTYPFTSNGQIYWSIAHSGGTSGFGNGWAIAIMGYVI